MIKAFSVQKIILSALPTLMAVDLITADTPRQVEIRGKTWDVWTNEDLRARHIDVVALEPSKNAAWVYIEAINSYEDPPPGSGIAELLDYANKTGWPGDEKGDELAQFLMIETNQRAMQLCVKGSHMEACQMPYFGQPSQSLIAVVLPNLSALRHLGKLMVSDGRRLVHEGHGQEALERYTAVLRMGSHAARGFTLIEGLVGIAVWAKGSQAVADLALHESTTKELLRRVEGDLKTLNDRLPTIDRGLKGERAFGPGMVDELCTCPTHLFRNLQGFPDSEMPGMPHVNPNPVDGWGKLEQRIGQLIIPDRTIKQHMEGYYNLVEKQFNYGSVSWQERELDDEAYIIKNIPKWDVVSRAMLPSLTRAILLSERVRTEWLLLRTVVAIRQYALAHDGNAPDSLDDLIGQIPEEVMQDPFARGRFRYRRTESGWVLYSIGTNLKDDGGVHADRLGLSDIVHEYPPRTVEPFGD